MGKIIGVVSLKGGVGKTSCTANLGAALANNFQKKVLIVDANFSAPNLAMHFGVFDYKSAIQDALLGTTPIQQTIHKYNDNLHIIPAAVEAKEIRDHYKLKEVLNKLRGFYDVILIDSSPSLHHEILSTMLASDELYVVTSPDYPTLSTTIHAIKVAKQRNTPIKGLILNRVYGKRFELKMDEIEEATGSIVLGVVPHDLNMLESVSATKPVSSYAPKSDATIELNKVAAHLIGEEYQDPRLWHKVKNFFRPDIRKDEVNRILNK